MSTLTHFLLLIGPALFFLGMGVVGLVRPAFVLGLFQVRVESAAGRGEVRAVYGGFGLAVAALLVLVATSSAATLAVPSCSGVVLAIGVSVGAMAGGRLLSALIDRELALYPTLFFAGVELALAGSLLWWWHAT